MKNDPYKSFISKPEVSFWFPIFIALIPLAVTYGVLSTKIDTVIKNQEQQYSMWLQLEKRVGSAEISIAKEEQFHSEIKNILKLN